MVEPYCDQFGCSTKMGRHDRLNTTNLTECRRELAASTVGFLQVGDTECNSVEWPTPLSPSHQPDPPIRYPIPSREAGNAVATPPRLRVSMADGDKRVS
ncbi:hypothetical protein EVAR_36465_1 [Eumeta japonica]|uniref:Uncharacterized protein n=1 Tax=Eumeta variegata TaxID=151549 RepID=A0A4C1WTQ9_EUMVA|nr:hypothetical protein EVAR_36465_1 [Eumeta japonica]